MHNVSNATETEIKKLEAKCHFQQKKLEANVSTMFPLANDSSSPCNLRRRQRSKRCKYTVYFNIHESVSIPQKIPNFHESVYKSKPTFGTLQSCRMYLT